MTRIRYFKQEDGSLKTKPLTATHDMLTVTVRGLTWLIKGSEGQVMSEGLGKNSAEMKKQIKAALKNHGVNTFDEVRKGKALIIPE